MWRNANTCTVTFKLYLTLSFEVDLFYAVITYLWHTIIHNLQCYVITILFNSWNTLSKICVMKRAFIREKSYYFLIRIKSLLYTKRHDYNQVTSLLQSINSFDRIIFSAKICMYSVKFTWHKSINSPAIARTMNYFHNYYSYTVLAIKCTHHYRAFVIETYNYERTVRV